MFRLDQYCLISKASDKHKDKRNLKKQILETSSQLKRCLTNIIYITLLNQINKAIKSKIKAVSAHHLKKLEKLCLRQNNVSPTKNNLVYLKHTICNMSSYQLTNEEERALSYGLDHHIPSRTDPNLIYIEFKSYFQNIKYKITNLPEIQISHLKTKLCNTCEQYNNINVPYKDVKSLFTYVPLDFTIDVILRRIYNENEVHTNIKRSEMKELLLLCTKNVHFTFNNDIYQQCDGVAMGSPLGPVIAGIFMVELERTLLPRLTEYMTPWKRYVDDTTATIKLTSIDHVLMILNTFPKNIKFTYELEINNKISFLDVLLIRKNDTLETTVYRKSTNNGVYLHWNSYAPKNWKRSTLRSILGRAYKILSTKELLDKELKCIEREFIEINGYPNG